MKIGKLVLLINKFSSLSEENFVYPSKENISEFRTYFNIPSINLNDILLTSKDDVKTISIENSDFFVDEIFGCLNNIIEAINSLFDINIELKEDSFFAGAYDMSYLYNYIGDKDSINEYYTNILNKYSKLLGVHQPIILHLTKDLKLGKTDNMYEVYKLWEEFKHEIILMIDLIIDILDDFGISYNLNNEKKIIEGKFDDTLKFVYDQFYSVEQIKAEHMDPEDLNNPEMIHQFDIGEYL